jgi:hypothetical protein
MIVRGLLVAFLVVFCVAGIAGTASAQAVASVQCEACSPQQKQDVARQEVDVGGVAVFSLSTGELNSFVVMPDRQVLEVPANPELAAFFGELLTLYRQNGGSLEIRVPAHVVAAGRRAADSDWQGRWGDSVVRQLDIPENAYEAVANPAKMNNVHEWMRWKLPSFIAGGQSFVRLFNPGAWLNAKSSQVIVRLEFADQSSMLITYNYETHLWERIPDSGRDGHNNHIPETAQGFAGGGYREYEFEGPPTTDLQNFVLWAHLNGIEISGSTGKKRFACSSAGDQVRCVAF